MFNFQEEDPNNTPDQKGIGKVLLEDLFLGKVFSKVGVRITASGEDNRNIFRLVSDQDVQFDLILWYAAKIIPTL